MKTLFLRLTQVVLVPVAFFVLLELGLRVGGFGRDSRFFVPDEEPGYLRSNPRYTELFFPASFGLKPVNFRLAEDKPDSRIRVLVMGGSAANGVPEPGFSIARHLEVQLAHTFQDREVEVFNLGVTAVNSHVIRHLARQAVTLEPDLLVVYMGNNEVVGPFGPGSATRLGMPPLPLIRASIAVRTTRMGQLLEQLIGRIASTGAKPRQWRGMEMFAGHSVSAQDPRMEAIYANFQANLEAILKLARKEGIPTVLSTVAVNIRNCSPFASQHHPSVSPHEVDVWSESFQKAQWAEGREAYAEAQDFCRNALAQSPQHADTHFLMARLLEKTGDWEDARNHYFEALQWDALRFRADATINTIIRDVALASPDWTRLVDAAEALGMDSPMPTALPGRESLFEHVHLNWEGNFRLARLLAGASAELLSGRANGDTDWLTVDACADRLGFTDAGRSMMLMSMDGLTSRPPFTAQMNYGVDRTWLLGELAKVNGRLAEPGRLAASVEQVDAALRARPDDPFLHFHAATLHAQTGNMGRALELNERLGRLEPPSAERAVQRAYLLAELGRRDDAEAVLLETAESSPYYFQTYGLLGALWSGGDTIDRGLGYFSALVDRMPNSPGVLHTYARLLAENGDWTAAEHQWLKILEMIPDDEGALAPLIDRWVRDGKRTEAVDLMQAAFDYNPRSLANNSRLVQVFDPSVALEESVRYLKALTESGPVGPEAYLQLAQLLDRLGRAEESLVALHGARAAAQRTGAEEWLEPIGQWIRSGRMQTRAGPAQASP